MAILNNSHPTTGTGPHPHEHHESEPAAQGIETTLVPLERQSNANANASIMNLPNILALALSRPTSSRSPSNYDNDEDDNNDDEEEAIAAADAADAAAANAPPTPTSQSNNPSAEDGRRVLCKSNSTSTNTKLKSWLRCGGLLVAGATVGTLATVFTRPALRQNGIQQQEMQAASPRSSKGGKDGSKHCGNPEVYCGMTIPAGKTIDLTQDLVCMEDTAGGGEDAMAITVEEGATLNCGGHSVVQLNDEWGSVGVELKSGAKIENCRVSGWYDGLRIEPPSESGGYADEIKINNCEATLNYSGLFAYVAGGDPPPLVESYSIKGSYFNHNGYYGIYADVSSKVNMEDVELNFNARNGIEFEVYEGSEITLNNVESKYNGWGVYSGGYGLFADTYYSPEDPPTKVILKGTNSFSGNTGEGFYMTYPFDVVVSRGATLNAYNNTLNGVTLYTNNATKFPVSLTVENGGAVNACGNGDEDNGAVDIRGGCDPCVGDRPGGSTNVFLPTSGKRYTCGSVAIDDVANGFTCENTCPSCALS